MHTAPIHVVVGVLTRTNQKTEIHEVFITRRHKNVLQGGLWEFPGGKVEEGETSFTALQRELKEELGICATEFTELLEITHDYPEYSVFIEVWHVKKSVGEPTGKEGQDCRWLPIENLNDYKFPTANQTIIKKLQSNFSEMGPCSRATKLG